MTIIKEDKEDVSNYFILWFLLYSNNYQIPLNNYTYDFYIDSIVSTHWFVSSSRRNLRHFQQKQGQQKKQWLEDTIRHSFHCIGFH